MSTARRAASFSGTVLSGHKGAAIACPFDPAERWSLAPESVASGRRGVPVRAVVAGEAFDSHVVARARRHWLLVGDAVLRAAGVRVGDTVAVTVGPRKAVARGVRAAPPAAAFDPLAFVREHGVVLVSGSGPVPRLSDAVAGETVRGSWWAHPRAKAIFDALQVACASPDVLVCKLVGGKQTLVHRRLWPALVRCADAVPPGRLDAVRQEHTSSGAHRNVLTPYPAWVTPDVARAARKLSLDDARGRLGPALTGE